MKAKASDWYKKNWTLDIKNMSWVENTPNEVDYIIDICGLKGTERVLDLACGYGRHSLEFAKRGFEVIGVDITDIYIEDARKSAKDMGLTNASFYCQDIRDVSFSNEFDVVLNLGDGAIGYLENDEENLKIFDVISRALGSHGQHICDLVCGDYAETHFPVKLWDAGEKAISLSEFDWDPKTRVMMFGNQDFSYGEAISKPNISEGDPTRIYTLEEIRNIMMQRGMKVLNAYAGYSKKESSANDFQMLVHSIKMP